MDSSRVKMKIGSHEFEAEGAPEIVQQQLEAFRMLVAAMPASAAPATSEVIEALPNDDSAAPGPSVQNSSAHARIETIMQADGRVVSLTALPASVEDSALLIMLGQRDLRNNVSVTGQEIGDGLAQSGKPASRVDRIMEKHIREAFILKTGLGRATRYRLTNQGLARAVAIARELIATLPT